MTRGNILRGVTLAAGVLAVGVAQATLVYQTSFEPGEGYLGLPANSYIPYYGDGTQGFINGGYGNGAGTLGVGWSVLPNGTQSGVDLVRDVWPSMQPTPFGDQWVDLRGTPSPGGIERTIAVTAGTTYTLSWYDCTIEGFTPSYVVDFGSLANVGIQATNNVWTQKSLSFTATADGNTVLRFFAAGATNGNTGIDNISVEAVPEPFTMALGASALGLAIARRRRSK